MESNDVAKTATNEIWGIFCRLAGPNQLAAKVSIRLMVRVWLD